MKEELQKIRDEEADRYNNNPYLSIIQRMEVHDIWTDGFDRAVELMEERVKILEEALEFYAKAKILFFVYREQDWIAKNPLYGIVNSGIPETHIKDDGNKAREALAKYREGQ